MKAFMRNMWKHRVHVVMMLPVVILLLMFAYIPMSGIILAFKRYDYSLGMWRSPWCGLENFRFLIASRSTFLTMTRNTLIYYVIFTGLGTFLNVALAIALDQMVFKRLGKTLQSVVIIPVFISYAAVQFVVYGFLNSSTGLINNAFGLTTRWYTEAAFWPVILTIVKMWSSVGYGSVLYMSVLSGVDPEQYEAAQIDGANKWQQIRHVSIPALIPMITIMLLLSVGNIMKSDTGLFYQVTRNSGVLYETTQVIDSYVLNSIFQNSNFGFTAATTLFQSVVGLALMLIANFSVRKISPENALF